jgi:hypothetical protein
VGARDDGMTERKPPGINSETWVDRQIREAVRRPLAGPPLNLTPYDVNRAVAEWRAARDREESGPGA